MSLYAWGSNKFGEISYENELSSWSPHHVELPEGQMAISIASGEGHSLIATESGDVLAFGRGREGQLGLGMEKRNVSTPTVIKELQHESVIKVAAGGISSYAITANGRVYHWGIVHNPRSNLQPEVEFSAASGQLTGLAEDQDILVQVDSDARNDQSYLNSRSNHQPIQTGPRILREIVQDSTERWMLANDGADDEYYRELSNMGYEKEELDERMQSRGREYHGMLKIQCRRELLLTPEPIQSLGHLQIVSISVGYAHCVVLTIDGRMLSVGYNDRGQLGLGHRISTSEFKPIDYMEGKFVLQVVCGQQHTMCRAIDRSTSSGLIVSTIPSMNKIPCSVYVWGNGMLGQLGLGLQGSSKGRLLPTLLTSLTALCPLGIIDISAGGNFSVALSLEGQVYSWGHAEYNQHGTGIIGGHDYIDNFHYFTPQHLPIPGAKISQVSCGSNFTTALTDDGDVYSWGWNAYGVLGQGKGFLLHEPMKIPTLGHHLVDRSVSDICAGANHVLALTTPSGNSWAKGFTTFLKDSTYADAEIIDELTGTIFPCHRIILSARSKYFRGYFLTAQRMNGGQNPSSVSREQVYLSCDSANATTIRYLLEYIYTDTLSAPSHKKKQLAELADFVLIPRLGDLCRQNSTYQERKAAKGESNLQPSTFESDLLSITQNPEFADIKFYFHDFDQSQNSLEPIQIPAHKVLLSRMPYFASLFSGHYRDGVVDQSGCLTLDLSGFVADGIDYPTFCGLLKFAYSGSHSIIEGEEVTSNTLMSLIVASNRVGLHQLSQLCEKKLSLHLGDYPENIQNCYEFALTYNIPRLGRQCEELLAQHLKA